MLGNRESGYAVMSPDFKGISLTDMSLENCKRYCFDGSVIVAVTPKKCGFALRVRYHKENNWFKFFKYDKVFFKCRFYIEWEWCHEYGRKVLYTNPYSYTESLKRGIIDY